MMKAFEKYLRKHPPFTTFNASDITPADVVVVIPVYLEDHLLTTLDSICQCKEADVRVAVLLVINSCQGALSDIIAYQKNTMEQLMAYSCKSDFIQFYSVEAMGLPNKHFGAGLARKIGMDLAIQHFYNTNNPQGIIASLDADTTVDDNYFESLHHYFLQPKATGCSIYFEHPVEGTDHVQPIYDAIIQYELHLRYYVESLRYIQFPYAYHTIGSCFAVKASAYVSAGGMNRRQAGEEFYFIQKIVQLGGYGELNSTTVRPSSRISTRVPFGTGPSVKLLVEGDEKDYLTYNPQGFIDLILFFQTIENYYQINDPVFQEEILKLPGRLRSFLLNSDFFSEICALSENCSSIDVFRKRFFHVFNAFKLVKYMNYIHEHFLEKVPVFDAAIELLQLMDVDVDVDVDDIFEEKELLEKYRVLQKNRL